MAKGSSYMQRGYYTVSVQFSLLDRQGKKICVTNRKWPYSHPIQ